MNDIELNQGQKDKKSILKHLSTVCKCLGCIASIFGIMAIIGSIVHDGEDIGITIGLFFGGFFTLVYGFVAEAIDDIRNSLKNNQRN